MELVNGAIHVFEVNGVLQKKNTKHNGLAFRLDSPSVVNKINFANVFPIRKCLASFAFILATKIRMDANVSDRILNSCKHLERVLIF